MKTAQSLQRRERVLLVGVSLKKSKRLRTPETFVAARESLAELEELAHSAGAQIEGSLLQVRDALDPATLVGRGKLDEIRAEAHSRHVPLVIVDHDLTPVQLRNMEKGTGCRVIDRTQLILDIFATHARSREGQLQVELAQLNYLLPRLTGRGEELSRLGGGIGTRGPGEQKLETDRRRIRDRVRKIQDAIETVRKQRTTRRRARQAVPLGMVALVGYTNAGKSTLFNALTHSAVLTSSKMFATLDPTIRAVRLPLPAACAALRHGGFLAGPAIGFDRRVSCHIGGGPGSCPDPAGVRYLKSHPRGTGCGGLEGFKRIGSGPSAAPACAEQDRSPYADGTGSAAKFQRRRESSRVYIGDDRPRAGRFAAAHRCGHAGRSTSAPHAAHACIGRSESFAYPGGRPGVALGTRRWTFAARG